TADAKSKTYGDADPVFTYQITSGSLAFSDDFSGSLTRDAGENVGAYVITQGTVALNSNYTLTYVGASLTIGLRSITITADAKSKTYGDADPALTYQITSGSLAFSDAFTGSLTRDAGENVGDYAIIQGTVALNSNYTLTYVGANLTIGLRSITITADAKSKTYGDADPVFTYQITSGSLAFSDDFTGALTRDAGENVGAYAITQGTVALNNNYTLTYVGANLTIGKADATISISNLGPHIYTGSEISAVVTVDPNVNGLEVTGGTGTNVGNYPVSALLDNQNYVATIVEGTLVIGKAPTTTTVTVAGGIFNGNPYAGSAIVTGAGGLSQSLDVNYNGTGSTSYGPTTDAPVNVGTYSASAIYPENDNYLGSNDSKPFTIGKASTSISVAPDSVQYSDQVTLVSTIVSPTAQSELNTTGGTVVFKIQLNSGPIINLGSSSASSSVISGIFTITQAPGTYKVIAVFTPNSANLTGCENLNTGPLKVKQENALAEYSGTSYFSTSSATSTKATVTLSVTVFDVNDDFRGDIRNARVTFHRGSPTTVPALGSANVGLVNESDLTVGTATTTFDYTLTNLEQSSGGVSFDVYVVVNNFYTGVSQPEVITISVPGQDNVTGGGYVVTNNSQGIYRGKVGAKTNFGFTMKYNKSGKNIQGQANIIVRAYNDSLYQIKSNSVNSMAINGKRANFETKANMKNITDPNPLYLYSLPGNFILTIAMFDSSAQGQSDSVSITYQNEAGGLLFSSNWNGTRSILQAMRKPFGGGNIRVATSVLAKDGSEEAIPTVFALQQNYPNPFNPSTEIRFDLPKDSYVRIAVYDIIGREVTVLVNEEMSAGYQSLVWNAINQYGNKLGTGVYFYRIVAKPIDDGDEFIALKKMLLIK
ncbi:MAG: MBG domain-containing protein, partial [Bacteroidota bacterium]|nr:MBG domain-containing protein [Bacteroidota bacterium]